MSRIKKERRKSFRGKMIGINLGVTLSSLTLCGLFFVVSVWFIVGKYVSHDLDFFLTETSDNLNSRLEYMEHTIYQIRDSAELMEYLEGDGRKQSGDGEEIQEIFRKAVNISSEKNIGSGDGPIVEKVYLFYGEGPFFSAYYYAMVYSEIEQSQIAVKEIYDKFKNENMGKKGKDYCFYLSADQKGYLAYTLYDEMMADRGSVVYEINMDMLNKAMKPVDHYENSFWNIYDDAGNEVISHGLENTKESLEKIRSEYKYKPYTFALKSGTFRLYVKKLSMNLNSVIGIPQNQTSLLLYDSVKIYIVIIAVIVMAASVLFGILIYKLTKPIREVADKIRMVKKGDFEIKLQDYDVIEFHEISQVFNEMTEYINHLIKQVYEKQLSIKEMELKFLQTQMNPHFMFNVLNSIALQAKMDKNEEVYKMIASFSQLIQAKIYRNGSEKVKIRQEMEYVQYYLYLQNYRYGDRLKYSVTVEEDRLLEYYIPKLCIQLIVENAVVHGIEPKIENGFVKIILFQEEESILIDVIDNGVGFQQEGKITFPIYMDTEEKEHNHVGLNNANHIIQLLYGGEYGIEIYSEKGGGSMVRIHIPLDDEKEKQSETNGEDETNVPCDVS